jgi:hypothetical protein
MGYGKRRRLGNLHIGGDRDARRCDEILKAIAGYKDQHQYSLQDQQRLSLPVHQQCSYKGEVEWQIILMWKDQS